MADQKMMTSAPVMPIPAAGAPVPPPSYYEASAGYPPQQGAYPPAQPGAYPPAQPGAYPPQQPGAYPPQQGYAQPGFAPGPSAPPQAGYGMAPPPGPGGYAPVPTMSMPPGAMPTVVQPGATVVVVQQAVHFRDHSVVATCPRCQQSVQTVTSTQNGALTWLICVLLCFFCPIIFCLPFCIDGMKDVVHRCPHCRTRMGTYTRL